MCVRGLSMACVALAAASCVLGDGRELDVEPGQVVYAGVDGPRDGSGRYVVQLQVKSSYPKVRVEIDGESHGDFSTDRTVEFRADESGRPLANGEHRLVVRALGATLPVSVERILATYDRSPALVSVTPAPGDAPTDRPFTIRLTSNVPAIRSLVRPDTAYLEVDGRRLLGLPRLSGDRRTIELDLPGELASYGTVDAVLSRRIFGGPEETWARRSWTTATLTITRIAVIGAVGSLAGQVRVRVSVEPGSDVPDESELLAGDRVIARLSAPPGASAEWEVDWDTRLLPDGIYPLSVRVPPGHHVRYRDPPPTYQVDNVPPGVNCQARTDGLPGYRACWDFLLDSPGQVVDARITIGEATLMMAPDYRGKWCPSVGEIGSGGPLEPGLFDPSTMDGSALVQVTTRTDAGVAGLASCEVAMPPWIAPWGEPLPGIEASGPVTFQTQFVCLGDRCAEHGAAVMAVGRGPEVGKVRLWVLTAAGTWLPSVLLNQEAGSVASGVAGIGWLERVGGGPGQVRVPSSGLQNLDPTHDAADLANAPFDDETDQRGATTWSEEVLPAGRAIAFDGVALPRLAQDAVATSPAAVRPWSLLGGTQGAWASAAVVWVEAVPGGVPQLRGVIPSSPAPIPIAGVENADPAQAASEPTVFGTTTLIAVAWREGSQVLARVLTEAGAGPAVVLNVDPARPARLPRLDPNGRTVTAYWIESTPDGDAIRVRRWTGSEWQLYPQPVNGPPLGEVTTFNVTARRVTWVDGAGRIHVRSGNFPR